MNMTTNSHKVGLWILFASTLARYFHRVLHNDSSTVA